MSARTGVVQQPQGRGMLYIHSAPAALCPHVEWALGAVLGSPTALDWVGQPAERGSRRAELAWRGPQGAAAALASRLAGFGRLRFEVTEDPSPGLDGHRYCFTPTLGPFGAVVGAAGDVLVTEQQIRRAIADDALGRAALPDSLARAVGAPWDDELEVFRYASEDAPVRWLHQVV